VRGWTSRWKHRCENSPSHRLLNLCQTGGFLLIYKASTILLVTLLFALGICIGVYVHTLDLIKNLILSGETQTKYSAPLLGVRFNLFYLWDLMSLMIMVSFVLTCFISILLGIILRRDWQKGGTKWSSNGNIPRKFLTELKHRLINGLLIILKIHGWRVS